MRWWIGCLAVGCGKEHGATGETGGSETDADVDADTDADVDADTDADTDPTSGTAAVRFVNTSPPFGVAYLFADGATTPLLSIQPLDASDWAPFPAGELRFTVVATGDTVDDGAALDLTVADQEEVTTWVAGPKDAPIVGSEVQDDAAIPVGYVRYSFHHTAVGQASVGLEAADAAQTLAFGDSVVVDGPAAGFAATVDLDADGVADWTFDLPPLGAGAYVPLFLTWDDLQLVLVGASPQGGSSVLVGTATAPSAP